MHGVPVSAWGQETSGIAEYKVILIQLGWHVGLTNWELSELSLTVSNPFITLRQGYSNTVSVTSLCLQTTWKSRREDCGCSLHFILVWHYTHSRVWTISCSFLGAVPLGSGSEWRAGASHAASEPSSQKWGCSECSGWKSTDWSVQGVTAALAMGSPQLQNAHLPRLCGKANCGDL